MTTLLCRGRCTAALSLIAPPTDFREQRKELLETHGAADLQEAIEKLQTELDERRKCVNRLAAVDLKTDDTLPCAQLPRDGRPPAADVQDDPRQRPAQEPLLRLQPDDRGRRGRRFLQIRLSQPPPPPPVCPSHAGC